MIVGPWIAAIIIKKHGIGGVPTEALFRISAIINCFTVLPLFPAYKLNRVRLKSKNNN